MPSDHQIEVKEQEEEVEQETDYNQQYLGEKASDNFSDSGAVVLGVYFHNFILFINQRYLLHNIILWFEQDYETVDYNLSNHFLNWAVLTEN